MTQFCLPIQVATWGAFLAELRGPGRAYDLVELWMDDLQDWSPVSWAALTAEERGKVLIVFRRDRLQPTRLDACEQLRGIDVVAPECALIDLDIQTQGAVIERVPSTLRATKLLASTHDYGSTPDSKELKCRADRLVQAGPVAIKLVTMCHEELDVVRLLTLLLELKRQRIRATVLGMGEAGRVSRVLGALWGNQLSFAPANPERASAPGQLSLDQLKQAISALRSSSPSEAT